MAYVVTKPCLGNKDLSCVSVCPVDCFYDIRKVKYNEQFGVSVDGSDSDGGEKIGMLMIHPDECINCGACETECPVEAIYEDSAVPANFQEFVKINEQETLGMTDAELEANRCTGK